MNYIEKYPKINVEDITELDKEYTAAGRIVSIRNIGKSIFCDLVDFTGKIQLYINKKENNTEIFEKFQYLKSSDIIGVVGVLFKTNLGEITLKINHLDILNIAVNQVPFGKKDSQGISHSELSNIEERYKNRYLDLLINEESKKTIIKRSKIIYSIREFLNNKDFLEIETPTLVEIPGGADCRSFSTYHNSLKKELKLRISLEIPLKKLIVGGFEKVYEIGKVYRNEGIDSTHSPEFTLLEIYQAYSNLEDMMELTKNLITNIYLKLNGINNNFNWNCISILDGISEFTKESKQDLFDIEYLINKYNFSKNESWGHVVEKLHEKYVQPNLIEPTFITDFPLDTSPLALQSSNSKLARRFELYIEGMEIANAYSELTDPVEQRKRLSIQKEIDENFISSLEYGMPPTGGLGIGIDRLVMLFTNTKNIKGVMYF